VVSMLPNQTIRKKTIVVTGNSLWTLQCMGFLSWKRIKSDGRKLTIVIFGCCVCHILLAWIQWSSIKKCVTMSCANVQAEINVLSCLGAFNTIFWKCHLDQNYFAARMTLWVICCWKLSCICEQWWMELAASRRSALANRVQIGACLWNHLFLVRTFHWCSPKVAPTQRKGHACISLHVDQRLKNRLTPICPTRGDLPFAFRLRAKNQQLGPVPPHAPQTAKTHPNRPKQGAKHSRTFG